MLPRLSRKMKWGVFGTFTTASCLYYAYAKNDNRSPSFPSASTTTNKNTTRATTTLTGKHLTHEEVVDGRQVLSNLGNFGWHDIPLSIRQRYTAPYSEPESDSPLWRAGNTLVIGSIGIISKFVMSCLETTKVYHMDRFLSIVHDDQRQRGIITVSNHMSVWDDPVLWGVFPMKTLLNIDKMRWVLGAADICYTSIFKATFFSMGKAIPTIRGGGIYQPAVDFAIDRLNHGGWIHVFPEGKVNQTEVMLRFKWGIGRLIMESDVCLCFVFEQVWIWCDR
ncbi:acyltransferase-domain-containing protein [Absidia repens]|uniref:Tafazzin family protein n=1 Tax=Absidia repens TaxID=90262 RepID=A0A1X2ITU0_9FUNG|nr:acyltransferase-domain-containing protein [Absidia repens]